MTYLGIESHFAGVHGPYELHRKEEQIKCTALPRRDLHSDAIMLSLKHPGLQHI